MSKLRLPVLALALAFAGVGTMPAGAVAMPAGPFARVCQGGSEAPALLVRVTGFKNRDGAIRVQLYGGDPSRYFDRGSYLDRIEVRVPPAGPLDVCLPVPAPGQYAVAVYHLDGSGKKLGGGTSGNPHVSAFSLMMRRKPAPEQVAVQVGRGVRGVPIILNYLNGLSFGPVGGSTG